MDYVPGRLGSARKRRLHGYKARITSGISDVHGVTTQIVAICRACGPFNYTMVNYRATATDQ